MGRETYGLEYDLDAHVVAVEDFNMGAMENKGLNVFNTACVLAAPGRRTAIMIECWGPHGENTTDGNGAYRDWFQLTLKEGLTVYRDQTFTEDQTSRREAH